MKVMYYYLFLFFFINNTYAIDFVKRNQSWFYSATDCDSLQNIAKDITQWSSNVDNKSKVIPDCIKVRDTYELNITDILPEKVSSILKEGVTYKNGHNCYNFSLFSQGLIDTLRYTSEVEFSQTLEQVGICKRLAIDQNPTSGDIAALRVVNRGEVTDLHAYVYLSKDIIMHKRGSLSDLPYELAYVHEIDSKLRNGLESSCPTCTYQKDIFRCDSKNKDDLFSKNEPARKQLHEVECLHAKFSTMDIEFQNQFKIKSNALKVLATTSFESAISRLMENKDKTKEKEISDAIRFWMHIKLQLRSMDAHL